MDKSVTSLEAQNEIRFLLSLLRISYPSETASRAARAIEQLLPSARAEIK